MIYLDANVFVYSAINNGEMGERSRALIKKIMKSEIPACTSVLTWDEVVYAIRKKAGAQISIMEGEKLINLSNINWLQADENIIFLSQKLMKLYNLKPRDAIHAATAIVNKCDSIISDDSDFDKIKEIKRVKLPTPRGLPEGKSSPRFGVGHLHATKSNSLSCSPFRP